MSRATGLVTGAGGGLAGLFVGLYTTSTAQAAVEVRPKLAEVGFVDAALTSHGSDWLFYHFPVASVGVMVVLCAVIGALVGWSE